MPGTSGLELLRAIKGSPFLAPIRVVLMGLSDNESAARAAGCAAYLVEPFGGQTILKLLPQLVPPEPAG